MAEHATSQVSLHPLVLINVSDHYTRIKVKHKGGGEEPRVFGVIFGVQNGMTVDIMESFEMVYTINQTTGAVNFDRDFLQKFLVTHPGDSTTHSSSTFNTKESLIRSERKELLFRFDNKPGIFLIKLT